MNAIKAVWQFVLRLVWRMQRRIFILSGLESYLWIFYFVGQLVETAVRVVYRFVCFLQRLQYTARKRVSTRDTQAYLAAARTMRVAKKQSPSLESPPCTSKVFATLSWQPSLPSFLALSRPSIVPPAIPTASTIEDEQDEQEEQELPGMIELLDSCRSTESTMTVEFQGDELNSAVRGRVLFKGRSSIMSSINTHGTTGTPNDRQSLLY